MRKETPDSEAVVSSEDERPWPSATAFGALPRKENGVPGFGGGIWSTQKRGSFKMEKTAQRNAAREAHLGAVNTPRSGLRADSTPSPSASEGSGALPFAIPLQPAPKAGRSLSHSQGQREASNTLAGANNQASVLPLGLLTEEVDTETDSELGGGISHTTSHPPIGTLQRTTTFPSTYDAYYSGNNPRDYPVAGGGAHGGLKGDRRIDAAFANLSLGKFSSSLVFARNFLNNTTHTFSPTPEPHHRRSQWQSHLGWDDVPNVNESRRHSLADIPTRRGSLAGADSRPHMGGGSFWPDGRIYDWEGGPHAQEEQNIRDG